MSKRQKSYAPIRKLRGKDCIREREYVTTSEKENVECIKYEYTKPLTEPETREFVGTVSNFLTEIKNLRYKESKAQICLELFQFLATPKSIWFMKRNKTFGVSVMTKLEDLQKDFASIHRYNTRFQMIKETIAGRMK